MQLSQKQNMFLYIFAFSQFTFNFEHLQEKDDPHG